MNIFLLLLALLRAAVSVSLPMPYLRITAARLEFDALARRKSFDKPVRLISCNARQATDSRRFGKPNAGDQRRSHAQARHPECSLRQSQGLWSSTTPRPSKSHDLEWLSLDRNYDRKSRVRSARLACSPHCFLRRKHIGPRQRWLGNRAHAKYSDAAFR